MKQPENQTKKYEVLFSEIDIGRIKIPRFQRDFVWDSVQTANLIDSIIKGYFFIRNKGKAPSSIQEKLLSQYFWWASLSYRFTSGAENKIAQDIIRMDAVLNTLISGRSGPSRRAHI